METRTLRNCLGHFTTGVTVITCMAEGEPHGATVNSFTAVSLDPALVLVSLDRRTKACRHLEDVPFTVHVLRERQDDLALHFAGKPADQPIDWVPGTGGLAPRLPDPLTYLACTPWRSYDGGDHVLFLGEIQEYECYQGDPLVFYLGKFRRLGTAFETIPWLESADCPSTLDFSWLTPAS
ncbi:MAG: flavin reductase [Pseudonocardiaceae bacterium]|nr:flavin reductase [Pseudonocardiaceae bacterium]